MLLVTGITGHTGGYFLQELIDHNYKDKIRCVVRENSDASFLDSSGLNIEKVIGDLNNVDFIKKSMVGVKSVMHIYNIHHSLNIVEIAIENNVDNVVLVHTTGIYSNFKNASQGYKDIEENISNVQTKNNHTTEITILRPTMIYGDLCDSNMSKFIKMVDKFKIMPVIDGGRSVIQPVNARDLGKAFYTVLVSEDNLDAKAYDLSGDKPIQMVEAFKQISVELDKKRIFISVPLKLGVFFARVLRLFTFKKIDYVERVQRMGEDRSYSHEVASCDFGYNPISFEEGISIEVKQYALMKKNKEV
jgi:uncharacterized protein YbjT (DUF2867 family)